MRLFASFLSWREHFAISSQTGLCYHFPLPFAVVPELKESYLSRNRVIPLQIDGGLFLLAILLPFDREVGAEDNGRASRSGSFCVAWTGTTEKAKSRSTMRGISVDLDEPNVPGGFVDNSYLDTEMWRTPQC